MANAQFISVEGMDGAGKTSVMATIQAWIEAQQRTVLLTREPGGTPMAEAIRDVLLTPNDEVMDVDTELLLMMAARNQHVKTKIQPALSAGRWVVSDRFFDASYAYQGYGRGMSTARIEALHSWAIADFKPNLTIMLDLPVAVGKARVAGRGEAETRFEQEQMAFFERVRTGYLARAAAEPERIRIVDATQTPEAVQQAVRDVLQHMFGG
jgi:dTMP kinase